MWTYNEFGTGMNNIHGRSRHSLAKASFMLFNEPGRSFSSVLGRQDVAAIFAKEKMEAGDILSGHIHATLERCRMDTGQFIIVPQDTTYFNYTTHKSMKGLGTIQNKVKGVLQHNILALNDKALPLGLLGQLTWTRDGKNADLFAKESDKWFKGLAQVNDLAGNTDKKIILVQDRESDIFGFFKADRHENVELLMRVCQDRNMEDITSGEVFKLQQAAEKLQLTGTNKVEIFRDNKQLTLTLEVKAGSVSIHPNKDKSIAKHKTKPMTLISAREIEAKDKHGNDCNNPGEAAHWLLLTTLELEEGMTAFDIVTYYSYRWRIERFHYVEKSGGLEVEKLLFDDVHTLMNAIAFYSIIAWRILYILYLAREENEIAASQCFEKDEITILEHVANEKIDTLKQAVKALGKIVGHQPSKKFPMPGAKKLGEALIRLNSMVAGLKIGKKLTLLS
jgi:hypothetical protein